MKRDKTAESVAHVRDAIPDDQVFFDDYFTPVFNQYREISVNAAAKDFFGKSLHSRQLNIQNQLTFARIAGLQEPGIARLFKKAHHSIQTFDDPDIRPTIQKSITNFIRGFISPPDELKAVVELEDEWSGREFESNIPIAKFFSAIDSLPNISALVSEQKLLAQAAAEQQLILDKLVEEFEKFTRDKEREVGLGFWPRGFSMLQQRQSETLRAMKESWENNRNNPVSMVIDDTPFHKPAVYTTAQGDIVCATEVGVPHHPEETDRPNEDRLFIHQAEKTTLLCIDGMGGMGKGDTAAEVMARTAQSQADSGQSLESVCHLASQEMWGVGIEHGGVCLASAVIDGDDLEATRVGDVRIIVVRDGEVVYATKDQGYRNHPSNAVTGVYPGGVESEHFALLPNDVVAVFSDGISDNSTLHSYYDIYTYEDRANYDISLEELQSNQKIASAITNNSTLQLAVAQIGAETLKEMTNPKGKADNLSLILYRHKPKSKE